MWFRYKNTTPSEDFTREVNAEYLSKQLTVGIQGETLRKRVYTHNQTSRRVYTFSIDPTELDEPTLAFMEEFFRAQRKFISFGGGEEEVEAPSVEGDWTEVFVSLGEMPISFLEEAKHFPYLNFQATTVGKVVGLLPWEYLQ